MAALFTLAAAACTGAVEPTATPAPTETQPPAPTATETEPPPPTETPEPTASAVPTESGEFISPYTPSAPTGSGASLDPVVLQLDFEDGAIYRIRMLTSQTMTQSFEGQAFDIGQKMGFEYTYTVTERDPDGNAWVDVEYTRALFEMETPFGTDTYDSADSPTQVPEGAEGIAAIVGSGFSMLIGPDGEVIEIEGLEEMYDRMLSALDISDPEIRQSFELTFREQFNEQAMKDQVSSLLFEFPEGSLQVGDTWTASQDTNALLPVVAETTYTLLEFDEDTALIEVKSQISMGGDEAAVNMGLLDFEMSIEGTQEGLIQVDLNTGLTNSVVDQTLSGQMIIFVEGEEIAVPLEILQTVQVESVQLTP